MGLGPLVHYVLARPRGRTGNSLRLEGQPAEARPRLRGSPHGGQTEQRNPYSTGREGNLSLRDRWQFVKYCDTKRKRSHPSKRNTRISIHEEDLTIRIHHKESGPSKAPALTFFNLSLVAPCLHMFI